MSAVSSSFTLRAKFPLYVTARQRLEGGSHVPACEDFCFSECAIVLHILHQCSNLKQFEKGLPGQFWLWFYQETEVRL